MNKKGTNEVMWGNIIKIILMLCVIIFFVYLIFFTDTGKRLREMLLDYKEPEKNMSLEELRSIGCDKPVAEIRTYQLPALGWTGIMKSKKIYMIDSEHNTGIDFDYEGGLLYHVYGDRVFEGNKIMIGSIEKGVIKINPDFLDENSEAYIKNKWNPKIGKGIMASISELQLLHGSYKLENQDFLCKSDSQIKDLAQAEKCIETCELYGGKCQADKEIKLPMASLRESRIYWKNSLSKFIIKEESGEKNIYEENGGMLFGDKKIGEIINNRVDISAYDKLPGFRDDLHGTYFDEVTKTFNKVIKYSACDATNSQYENSGFISYRQLDCLNGEKCCVSENIEEHADSDLKIENFDLFGTGNIDLLSIKKIDLESGKIKYLSFSGSSKNHFCYVLSTDNLEISRGYNPKDKKMEPVKGILNPSLDKQMQLILWNADNKTLARKVVKLNVSSQMPNSLIEDGDDFKNKANGLVAGDSRDINIEPVWFYNKGNILIGNFKIFKTSRNDLKIQGYYSQKVQGASADLLNEKKYTDLDCGSGWLWSGITLDINKIENSFRNALIKNCKL